METNAQNLLNLAFRQLVAQYNTVSSCQLIIDEDSAFDWKDGEAESWVQDIISGRVSLSFMVNNKGLVIPCLR